MSQTSFFREKAAECALLAQNADEPLRRARYQEDARLWTKIAERSEANEEPIPSRTERC